ncbi:MAG: hypothetical protein RNU03_06360 [Candidatus Sedimenticola sp. (ex Thyasira tokunagai)]
MCTLICTIELNKHKDKGITIKVDGKGCNVKHAIQLTKDSITMTSNNGENTTVITQKADSIKLDDGGKDGSVICIDKKKISINSEEIILQASGCIRVEGKKVYLGKPPLDES